MYRVAHIITGLNSGGAEMMLCKLVTEMEGENCTSVVISLMDSGSLGEYLESSGIPVYSLQFRQGRPGLRGVIKLVKVIRSIRPDLIQGWMYHGNMAAFMAGLVRGWRVPVVWNIRQSVYDLNNEKFTTRIMIRIGAVVSKKISCIIYNSRTSESQHCRLGYDSTRSMVIPNGFNINRFRPDNQAKQAIRASLGIAEDIVLVGLIARYHPMKDHGNFFRAAALVVKKAGRVHFVIAGRGSDDTNPVLSSLIENSGLEGKVSVLGEFNDMPQLMASLDLLVVSSCYGEGFPNVVGEAMASGTPCVVTDTGDSAYVVGDAGAVVPPKDSSALAISILGIISMTQESRDELGRKARNRVVTNFSLEDIADSYDAVYHEVLLRSKDERSV